MIRFILCTTVIVMWKYDYFCACTVPQEGKKLQLCKLVLHIPDKSIRQRVSERNRFLAPPHSLFKNFQH